jgi:hypothetical protein
MNLDDPKLTAYALGELHEPERSTIAHAVADSPEAQKVVDEARELAHALKREFAAELKREEARARNLIDIRDDPWFWSRARPLAIAASIAILALLGAIAVGTYRLRQVANSSRAGVDYADVEGDEKLQPQVLSDSVGPRSIANPLRPDAIRRIERVVIGEIDGSPHLKEGEIRVIEIISDRFRVQRLKDRLTTPVLEKKARQDVIGHTYELMFLDRSGHVVASADFYHVSGLGFVLHPSRHGYEREGRYFSGGGDTALPGDWESGVNYLGYVIPFPDWNECIGYSPSA